jgi:diacylglycerol kinase (ATP)
MLRTEALVCAHVDFLLRTIRHVTSAVAAVIYNPIKVDLAVLKAAVAGEAASASWKVEWFPTQEDDPGQGPARDALRAGATLVIVAGGDGTVRAVGEVVRGTSTSLALLPSGTGNLLARNLKLTLDDVPASIHTAFTGVDRPIDVANIELRREDQSADSHAFLVMAGTGLDAKIMTQTDDDLKKKVGWLAYAQALVAVLRDKSVLRLDYKLDDNRNVSGRAQSLIVGNCGSLPANIVLMPDATVDDGLFDLIVLKPESVRGWLAVVFTIFWENGIIKRTRWGNHVRELDSASVDLKQGRSITVRLSRPEIVQLDGDPFGEMVGCRITIEPGALVIKVPVE